MGTSAECAYTGCLSTVGKTQDVLQKFCKSQVIYLELKYSVLQGSVLRSRIKQLSGIRKFLKLTRITRFPSPPSVY